MPTGADQAMRQFRVLIVDDDASTRVGLSELLETAGYDTCVVGTLHEGLHALHDYSPDVLIADIRLGSFNGLYLLIVAPQHVPAIIMTGFDDPLLEADAQKHGAEYVLKPVDPPLLLRLVQRCLSERHGSIRGAPPSQAREAPNGIH